VSSLSQANDAVTVRSVLVFVNEFEISFSARATSLSWAHGETHTSSTVRRVSGECDWGGRGGAMRLRLAAAIARSVTRDRPGCSLATRDGAIQKAGIPMLSNDVNARSIAGDVA